MIAHLRAHLRIEENERQRQMRRPRDNALSASEEIKHQVARITKAYLIDMVLRERRRRVRIEKGFEEILTSMSSELGPRVCAELMLRFICLCSGPSELLVRGPVEQGDDFRELWEQVAWVTAALWESETLDLTRKEFKKLLGGTDEQSRKVLVRTCAKLAFKCVCHELRARGKTDQASELADEFTKKFMVSSKRRGGLSSFQSGMMNKKTLPRSGKPVLSLTALYDLLTARGFAPSRDVAQTEFQRFKKRMTRPMRDDVVCLFTQLCYCERARQLRENVP